MVSGDVTHEEWKRIDKEQQRAILDYLHSLPLNIDVTVKGSDYKLVHGAPLEMYGGKYREQYRDAIQLAIFKRIKISDELSGKYTLIFGHTPTIDYDDGICPMRIFHSRDKIAIDCSSGFPEESDSDNLHLYGKLACLRLDDMKEYYSEEGH